ncbi:hypothetical protein BJX99DRAFT_253412 [Aspergillus californicus]
MRPFSLVLVSTVLSVWGTVAAPTRSRLRRNVTNDEYEQHSSLTDGQTLYEVATITKSPTTSWKPPTGCLAGQGSQPTHVVWKPKPGHNPRSVSDAHTTLVGDLNPGPGLASTTGQSADDPSPTPVPASDNMPGNEVITDPGITSPTVDTSSHLILILPAILTVVETIYIWPSPAPSNSPSDDSDASAMLTLTGVISTPQPDTPYEVWTKTMLNPPFGVVLGPDLISMARPRPAPAMTDPAVPTVTETIWHTPRYTRPGTWCETLIYAPPANASRLYTPHMTTSVEPVIETVTARVHCSYLTLAGPGPHPTQMFFKHP